MPFIIIVLAVFVLFLIYFSVQGSKNRKNRENQKQYNISHWEKVIEFYKDRDYPLDSYSRALEKNPCFFDYENIKYVYILGYFFNDTNPLNNEELEFVQIDVEVVGENIMYEYSYIPYGFSSELGLAKPINVKRKESLRLYNISWFLTEEEALYAISQAILTNKSLGNYSAEDLRKISSFPSRKRKAI